MAGQPTAASRSRVTESFGPEKIVILPRPFGEERFRSFQR
jgi:hypothetical protein